MQECCCICPTKIALINMWAGDGGLSVASETCSPQKLTTIGRVMYGIQQAISASGVQVSKQAFLTSHLQAIVESKRASGMHDDAVNTICSFLLCLVLAPESSSAVRTGTAVLAIVEHLGALQRRRDAAGKTDPCGPANRLLQLFAALDFGSDATAPTAAAHWPGGRHDNDHLDFRQIQALPTAAELASGTRNPFLPLADMSDGFLVQQVRL